MKSKLIQDVPEKTFALVFDAGEEVVAGLLQFARDHELSGAHLTAIGAFERVTLGFFDMAKKDYKKIPIQEQVELMSLVGNVARDDKGNPKLHAHVVVGKSDGSAHGVICWTPTFGQPWKSWWSKRHDISVARYAASSVWPCWISRLSARYSRKSTSAAGCRQDRWVATRAICVRSHV
jgi:uncharacterized protein